MHCYIGMIKKEMRVVQIHIGLQQMEEHGMETGIMRLLTTCSNYHIGVMVAVIVSVKQYNFVI